MASHNGLFGKAQETQTFSHLSPKVNFSSPKIVSNATLFSWNTQYKINLNI